MPLPRIAVTMGDPAGIGPEICLKALMDSTVRERCDPMIFGDLEVLEWVAEACRLPCPREKVRDAMAMHASAVQPGRVNAACGLAAYTYIERGIKAALAGEVAAVVTAPIHKEALNAAGIKFAGHTEIFAAKTNVDRYCMLQTSPDFSVSFVTTHVPHADVPALITRERVLEVIELTEKAMGRLRGRSPRLTVCGLNPHAGEGGLFGDEERRAIIPAVAEAKGRGIDVGGPIPPDTAFLASMREKTDAYVCMYHDQGHIPLKMLAFDCAVNTTLGLPVVRTSVDHGTAFDIAWQGKASPGSMIQAILLAVQLAA